MKSKYYNRICKNKHIYKLELLSSNTNITMKDIKKIPTKNVIIIIYQRMNLITIVINILLKERLKFNKDDLLKYVQEIKYKFGNIHITYNKFDNLNYMYVYS